MNVSNNQRAIPRDNPCPKQATKSAGLSLDERKNFLYTFQEGVNALLRTNRSNVVLVHAFVSKLLHEPYDEIQVWVEGRNGVYSQLDQEIFEDYDMAKKEFYDSLKIEKIRRYTIPEMMNAILKYRHFGPWEFDEYLDDSRPCPLKKFNVNKATAIHEAAHAVCSLQFFPVIRINWVVVSPSGENVGQCCWIDLPSDPICSASVSMAGVVAEVMLSRNSLSKSKRESCAAFISGNRAELQSYHDKADVTDALGKVHIDSRNRNIEKRKVLVAKLQQVVKRVAPQIKAVAGALMKKPFLTGEEVYRLCGMNWRLVQK